MEQRCGLIIYTHTDPHTSSGTLTGKTWCFSEIALNSVAILGIAHSEALKQFMTLLLRCKLNFTISELLCVCVYHMDATACINAFPSFEGDKQTPTTWFWTWLEGRTLTNEQTFI